MDYKSWLEFTRSFLKRIKRFPGMVSAQFNAAAPLQGSDLLQIDQSLRIKTPRAIRQFVCDASAGVSYEYIWYPTESAASVLAGVFEQDAAIFGRLRLCHAREFDYYQRCSQGNELWHSVFPFGMLRSGDLVGVDTRHEDAVVYMSHDTDATLRLADSFDRFLELTSQFCYVEPTFWHVFIGPESLNIKNVEKYKRLHELFAVTGGFPYVSGS